MGRIKESLKILDIESDLGKIDYRLKAIYIRKH